MCRQFRQECNFVMKCALTPQCAYMCVIYGVLTLHRKWEILRKEVFVSCERSSEVIWNLVEKQINHGHSVKYSFSKFTLLGNLTLFINIQIYIDLHPKAPAGAPLALRCAYCHDECGIHNADYEAQSNKQSLSVSMCLFFFEHVHPKQRMLF